MSIIPSFPYTLANGTTADASQVMADFLQIQTDVNTFAAPLASPAFTGIPTAPTPLSTDSSGTLATTSFVTTAIAALSTIYAPIASPTFTGTLTAPVIVATTSATISGLLSANSLAIAGAASIGTTLSVSGAATLASVTVAGAAILGAGSTAVTQAYTDSSTKIATTGFVRLRTTPNPSQSAVASPTGTNSGTPTMMGLAGSFTAMTTGQFLLIVTLTVLGNNSGVYQIQYGTGSAPANGAAVVGTAAGQPLAPNADIANASAANAITLVGIVTGLVVGTTYWLDITQACPSGNFVTPSKAGIIAVEL